MLLESLLLPTLLVPAVAASAVIALFVFGTPWGRSRRGIGAIATALAFVSGYVTLTGWPRWPPIDATQRLFFAIAAAALLGWFVDSKKNPGVAWLTRGLLVGVLLPLLLQSQIVHRWTTAESAGWLIALLAVGLGLQWSWYASLRTEGAAEDWLPFLVRLALLGGTATVLALAGSARLAQLLGALTCGVGVVEVASRALGRKPWRGGAALLLAGATLGFVVIGHFYAELSALAAALIVLGFLLLGLPVGNRPAARLLALAPLTAALALAGYAAMNQPEDPYADLYGSSRPAIAAGPEREG